MKHAKINSLIRSCLVVLVLMTSMGGYAQESIIRPKPVPTFVPMADDGKTEQYLYNIEAGGFFMAGNDWETRASINYTEGAKVKMTKTYKESGNNDTWQLWNYVPKFQEYRKAFAENPQSIWTDNNNGANCNNWIVTALGDNKYEITNPLAGPGKLGMAQKWYGAPNTRLWLLDPIDGKFIDEEGNCFAEGACTTWAFVSVEEYDALIPRLAIYNASLSLKVLINSEDAKFVDTSAAIAIYNNPNSTAEELTKAAETLKQTIIDAKTNQATYDNPTDMTVIIVNPNFDNILFDGWDGSGWGAGGTTDECAERYEMAFDTYQDIEGLEKGVYKVVVNGFFRGPTENTPVLYAKSDYDTQTTLFYNRNDISSDFRLDNTDVYENNQYYPNTMRGFVAYEDAGMYNDMFVYIPVGESGKLRIGVKKERNTDTDWAICDTWRLVYYGSTAASYKIWYDDIKQSIIARMDCIVDEDTKYNKNLKTAFEAAIAAGEIAQSEADFREAIKDLDAAVEAAIPSIEAYSEYIEKIEEIREYLDKHNELVGYKIMECSKYVSDNDAVAPNDNWKNGSARYILDNCTLSTEEIIEETAFMNQLLLDAMNDSYIIASGQIVDFLVNPLFTEGRNGWTGSGTYGGLDIFPSVEVYNDTVDFYQEVEYIPNGIYSLTCNAFYRPANTGDYNGTEISPVVLYP